jgi:hypothetical protein
MYSRSKEVLLMVGVDMEKILPVAGRDVAVRVLVTWHTKILPVGLAG